MNRAGILIMAALAVFLAVFLSAWLRRPDNVRPLPAVASPPVMLEPVNRYLNPGTNHLCYRGRNGAMECWGNNTWDQINTDPTVAIPPGQRVRLERPYRMVSGGNGHTCGIALDGRVWCWGDASMGQMGDGDSYTNTIARPQQVPDIGGAVRIASGYDGSCALIRDGAVYCWGTVGRSNSRLRSREFKVLRTPQRMPLPEPAAHLSFRVHHGCAVGVSGAVYCWGFNAMGALGDGSTVDRMAPVKVRDLPEKNHPRRRRLHAYLRHRREPAGVLLGLERPRPIGQRSGAAVRGRPPAPAGARTGIGGYRAACDRQPHLRPGFRRPGVLLGL